MQATKSANLIGHIKFLPWGQLDGCRPFLSLQKVWLVTLMETKLELFELSRSIINCVVHIYDLKQWIEVRGGGTKHLPRWGEPALLDVCVCMYVCVWPCTENLIEQTGFKFAHVLKQIPVRWTNSMPMKAWLIDKGRLLTDSTVKSRTVVAFASGKGHA